MFDFREPEEYEECPDCFFYISPIGGWPINGPDYEWVIRDTDFEYECESGCPRCHGAGVVKTNRCRSFCIETKIQKCPEWAFGVDDENEDSVKFGRFLWPDRTQKLPVKPKTLKKEKPVADLEKPFQWRLELLKKPEPQRPPAPLGELFVDKPVRYLLRGDKGNVVKSGLSYLRRGGFKDCWHCGKRGGRCKLINWDDGSWDVMCPKCGCNGISREFDTKEKAMSFWEKIDRGGMKFL